MTLAMIFLFGLAVRIYNLNPLMTFTYDQGRDMLELAKIANGNLTLIGPTTGIPGFFLGPFHFYALLPGFILGNGSPFAVAYWNALIIFLPFMLLLGLLQPMVGKKLALLAFGWLAILPGAIENARRIWNPSFTASVLLIMVFCLFKSVDKQIKHRSIWLSAAMFSFGLALQTELAYVIFLTPILLWWLMAHWKSIYKTKTILVAILAGASTLLPQILFEFRNNFLLSTSLLAEMQDPTKQVSYTVVWQQRPSQIFSALTGQFFSGLVGGELLMALLLIFTAGLIYRLRLKLTNKVWFLLLWSVVPLMGMMLFRGNHGYFFDYYISSHYLPIILLLILGIHGLKQNYQIWAIGLVSLSLCYSFWHLLPSIINKDLLGYTIGHQYQALTAIRESTNKHDPVGLDLFVPNLLPVQYQYINQRLNQQIPSPQVETLITGDQTEYYLISEPAFEGASEVAYQEWRARSTRNAECITLEQFGIVKLEKCTRL